MLNSQLFRQLIIQIILKFFTIVSCDYSWDSHPHKDLTE